GSRAHARVRQALVVAEIALTVTVLTGAVLLGRSLMRLQSVNPGFEPAGLASFRLALPGDPYEDDERLTAFVSTLEDRLRANIGVSAVAFSMALPPNLLAMSNNYTLEGTAPGSPGSGGVAEWNVVSPAYFSTMGIRLIRGQPFSSIDRAGTPRVAIVNEAFASRHYPDGRVLGARYKGGDWDPAAPWTTIVGVVSDVPYGKGLWGGPDATVYLPHAQNLWMQSFYVAIKADVDPARVLRDAEQTVRSLDPSLPLRDAAMMSTRLRDSMIEPRLRSLVSALIAGLALALAVTGIYGVMAYQVNQRRHETAIRRALGATAGDVVRDIMSSGLRLTCAGILLGGIGAMLLTRSLSAVLFQITPRDPASFAVVALLLAGAALLACAVPALRTVRIEPAAVLRDDG
ncbi:MAG: FtsX-like permease family protein, partial [Burkholderiales bacterium]